MTDIAAENRSNDHPWLEDKALSSRKKLCVSMLLSGYIVFTVLLLVQIDFTLLNGTVHEFSVRLTEPNEPVATESVKPLEENPLNELVPSEVDEGVEQPSAEPNEIGRPESESLASTSPPARSDDVGENARPATDWRSAMLDAAGKVVAESNAEEFVTFGVNRQSIGSGNSGRYETGMSGSVASAAGGGPGTRLVYGECPPSANDDLMSRQKRCLTLCTPWNSKPKSFPWVEKLKNVRITNRPIEG